MSLNFSEDEVRKHLSELGYRNIPEGKLEAFVGDLRRLIKYEERKKRLDRKLDNLEQTNPQPPAVSERRRSSKRKAKADPNTPHTTESSRRENLSARTYHHSQPTSSSTADTSSSRDNASEMEESSLYVDIHIPRSASTQSLPPPLAASLLQQPAQGVIRCRSTNNMAPSLGARRGRSDPVRLHAEYRKAWGKLNLPGETSHSKLRWAVRGWMMGEEPPN